jgi:hypothetical protein
MSSNHFRAFLAAFLVVALALSLTLAARLGRYTMGSDFRVLDHWTGKVCTPDRSQGYASTICY